MKYIDAMLKIAELLKLLMLAFIVWQVTSFGNTIVTNLSTINDSLGTVTARVRDVGAGLASDEFKEKATDGVDNVIGIKRDFIDKWKERKD